jgi:hypothetical protein
MSPGVSAWLAAVSRSRYHSPQNQSRHEDVEQPGEHDAEREKQQPNQDGVLHRRIRSTVVYERHSPNVHHDKRECYDGVQGTRCQPCEDYACWGRSRSKEEGGGPGMPRQEGLCECHVLGRA